MIGKIKKGLFHRWLGKSPGAPITAADIAKGLKAGGHPAKMAAFAKAAKGFHHGGKAHKSLYAHEPHAARHITGPREEKARKVWAK